MPQDDKQGSLLLQIFAVIFILAFLALAFMGYFGTQKMGQFGPVHSYPLKDKFYQETGCRRSDSVKTEHRCFWRYEVTGCGSTRYYVEIEPGVFKNERKVDACDQELAD